MSGEGLFRISAIAKDGGTETRTVSERPDEKFDQLTQSGGYVAVVMFFRAFESADESRVVKRWFKFPKVPA